MKAELVSALTDPRRLAALRRTELLDTPPEESFDRLTRVASQLLGAPIALVSLVTEDRQFFKSCIGLAEPLATSRATSLSYSFCRHAVESAAPLIVEDARAHPLVRDNPSIDELGVIAYAGIPLITADGQALGTLCVLDTRPRRWTAEQIDLLRDLSAWVMTEIRLRESAREAERQGAAEAEARREFEDLVQGLDAIVWEMDLAAFRFTFVSERAEHLLGYPARRWVDEPGFWQDVLLHPDDRQWAVDFCRAATAESRDYELEYRVVRADGEVLWLRDLVRVVRDEAMQARRLRGVMIDISEQKKAVEELRRRQAQLSEAQALAHLGSWEVDLATDRLTWSDELYRLCGLEPQSIELSSADFLGFIHPDDRADVKRAVQRAIRGEPYCMEARLRSADGTLRHGQLRGEVVLDREGRPVRLRGTGQDITDRRLAEEARLRAEAEARDMASRMRAVAGAAAGVFGADSVEALQHVLREECRKVVSFDAFVMALYDPSDHTLTNLEGWDTEVRIRPLRLPAAGTPAERVIRSRRSLVTRRSGDPEAAGSVIMGTGRPSESIIRSPILGGDRALGVISVQSYTPDLYTPQDVAVLEAIASLAATALLNLELLAEREAAEAALLRANEELEQRVADRTAELRQRTAELQAIFHALPDLYFRLSPDGTVLDHHSGDDDRLLPDRGYPGLSLTEVLRDLSDEAAARIREAIGRVNRTGRLVLVEYLLSADGDPREFEARLLPLGDGSLIAIVRDITDRKHAERELQRREEHFRRLIENAHDFVEVVDLDGTTRYISPAVERILGYAPEELIGTAGVLLADPAELEVGRAKLAEAAAEPGLTVAGEFRARHRDGSVRVLETFARTLAPDCGDEGIVINARDITERKHFEEALREREEWFRSLIENAHDMVQVISPEGTMIYISPSVERILGFTPEELTGGDALDLLHSDDRARGAAALKKMVLDPHSSVVDEFRLRHKDGGYRLSESIARFLSPHSPERGIVVNARDITERYEAEEALRRSEEHFRGLSENAHDLVIVVDDSSTVLYISPSVERILGIRPEELLGRQRAFEIHPEDTEIAYAKLAETLAEPGCTVPGEIRIRHRDGSWRVLETFARTLSPASTADGVVINARDITERKEAEAELERQRAYFEQLLASVDAGIAAWDALGRFEYVSPTAMPDAQLREWVIGRTQREYGAYRGLAPELVELRARSLADALRTRQISEFEETLRMPDGSPKHLLRRNLPILDPAGEIERVIGYSVDITERKRTEEALRRATEDAERAREAAEQANRAKSEFLSRMSHELRTPMNSILGFAQLLDRAQLAPEHRKGVGHILKAGRHLLQLINEVLEIARIESGRHSLSLEPVRADAVMQEALGLVRPLAAQRRVELDDGPWSDCDAYVHADRQRLAQVLLNLLSNAIKYNRPGGRVRLSCETLHASGRVAVRVEDTGRGIPENQVGQLFIPFARLGAERSDVEGTGLGLALSQRLTEAMGGTLQLERSGPEGSVFRLELELSEDPIVREEHAHAPPMSLRDDAHAPARLLYIEDNLANLSLVEAILEARPRWKALPALQGQIGVELAREHLPDLILLDLHLPDIPGEEVLRRLRSEPATASIPIVVITADATSSTIEQLREAGADAYLTKPLEVDEFLETLGRFLPGTEASEPAAG
jgi:PAS domain S-box-containing protein